MFMNTYLASKLMDKLFLKALFFIRILKGLVVSEVTYKKHCFAINHEKKRKNDVYFFIVN